VLELVLHRYERIRSHVGVKQCAVTGGRLAARDNRRGIPQGSPISPLLANLYMRRFVLGWTMLGLERRLGSRIVTCADDLVILCQTAKVEETLRRLRELMGQAEADGQRGEDTNPAGYRRGRSFFGSAAPPPP